MRLKFPRTLFGQLILGILVVQALVLGVFLSYIIVSSRSAGEIRTKHRLDMQLERLAAVCSRQLASGDIASVHDSLELSRISTSIELARLTDLTGKTLSVSDSGRDHGLDPQELAVLRGAPEKHIFAIQNGQLEAVTPVTLGGKPVAMLWLEPNRSVALNTPNTLVHIALTYGLLALLSNVLPIFLIVRTMTRPLRRLSEATQHLTRDDGRDGAFPLPVTTKNEAGELTISFNTMVKELEEQRSGLMGTLALLDSMLANAPIGFGFFDAEFRYVRLNQFLADVYEAPIETYLGHKATELFPGALAKEMETLLAKVFASGHAIRNVELTGEAFDAAGLQRCWLMHFYPVRAELDAIQWVGVVAVEITERRQTEEALRKTEKLAAAGRLAASIAHEINNPLEAVTNLLYLLRTHETIDANAMEFVTMAEAELERVSEITQQTLRFYRQSTSPTFTRVADVLDSVVKLYQSRINSVGVVVERRFRGEPEVFGFGGELRQVFANLVGNALDAMQSGGKLLLRVREGCGLWPDGTWGEGVRILVADTGTGMSAETLRKAFEAFFTTKQVTGTGLGLWLSEEIIRKHSGSVWVKSRTGSRSGTCFAVFFRVGVGRCGQLFGSGIFLGSSISVEGDGEEQATASRFLRNDKGRVAGWVGRQTCKFSCLYSMLNPWCGRSLKRRWMIVGMRLGCWCGGCGLLRRRMSFRGRKGRC
jgi:signal transduction histidine kinase/HAMP domain-containing protein